MWVRECVFCLSWDINTHGDDMDGLMLDMIPAGDEKRRRSVVITIICVGPGREE